MPAYAEYWELPQALADGRFPSFFAAKAGPVLVWQESQASGETGKAWIRFARFEDGTWKKGSVSDSAYSFTSAGAPPILYSAAQARDGTIAVAISASGTSVEIKVTRDGGRSFEAAGSISTSVTSVAPRIYPGASGGWLLFVTQGRTLQTTSAGSGAAAGAGEADQDQAVSIGQPSVSIYVARSADAETWSDFAPLVADSEGLLMNLAPSAAVLGGVDVAVFQHLIPLEGNVSSHYVLMSKTSSDGGATWSPAKAITDFPDPSGGADAAAQNFDNQNAQLALSGGRLYVAWERRKTKSTQTQVWAGRLDEKGAMDPKGAGPAGPASGSFMLSQLLDFNGAPALVVREDKAKANRILLSSPESGSWSSEDEDLAAKSDRSGSGFVAFARALSARGRSYFAWQLVSGDLSRIFTMVPDTSVDPPSLAPLNFAQGRRTRAEAAQIAVVLPKDVSGIKDFAYVWKRTPDKASAAELAREAPGPDSIWKEGTRVAPGQAALSLAADQDGSWTLWAADEDNAGNRSSLASISFYRKRTPPAPPLILPPDMDPEGFLASNTFTLRWLPPEGEELAGYTWDLSYAGPLEGAAPASYAAKTRSAPAPASPGLTAYESSLLSSLSLRSPPPGVVGTAPAFSATNVDDGYYVFTVAAIDTTGNISGASSTLLKADKYRPYTAVTLYSSARDELGRTVLKILGKGFLAEGTIDRVAVDRRGREPYDVDRSLAKGEYSIGSDREIDGITFEGLEAGSYRIGVHHSVRGWYWTGPIVTVDVTGTVKYGLASAYQGAFRAFAGRGYSFSIYDAIVLMALAFAAAGILLSMRQVMAVAREGETVRREALALVTGGPMPQESRRGAGRALRRRSSSLRVKFTLIITALVLFVVLLLAIALGYNMIRRTSSDLAGGLDQRAKVLLESVAQGGRFFMGTEDAVKSLSLFPSQAKAMEGADYITITGLGTDAKVASGEVVYATNDDGISPKLDAATLGSDKSLVLGHSAFDASAGAKDPLAPTEARLQARLQQEAADAISSELQGKAALAAEKAALKADAAGNDRRSQINAELDAADLRIRDILRSLSDRAIGSIPSFDPTAIAAKGSTYLYYKPILEYRPSDTVLYRGMVRLQVDTTQIAADVQSATYTLVRLTLIIAAVALGLGIAGAFILSTVIVVPIRKLVAQIERIRDTEDKESLEGSKIEVNSHDELYTLASTVNQMTEGLVSAAKASKELIIGKGIQKMFIPLDSADRSKAKLSTGRRDEKDFEVFGYYEGAKGVSGDYWDFRSINSRYHYFIKCDISGKGVSAALIMVQVATMVINYFNDWKKAMPKTIDLTDLTYKINDFLEERKFPGRFAAFTLGVWDSAEGIAYLCEAGDRKLHIWKSDRGELVEEMLPDSPAAGPLESFLIQMKNPFEQVVRRLGKGDALMLYTDGIEEAKRHFRDSNYNIIPCTDAPQDEPHGNHSGGQDGEEFGYDRIKPILEAVSAKGSYSLVKQHNPVRDEVLTFDFSTCEGSLEERVIALLAIEKVFRLYRDPSATEKDTVLVDQKIDAFLARHFDQYRLLCSDKRPYVDPENPGYLLYAGVKEDAQYDDLTILGIMRK